MIKSKTSPIFSQERFEGLLQGARVGRPVHVFGRLGSTMDEAHRLAQNDAPEGTLVVALCQEQGRGRLGRTWVSPEGGIYLSLVLRPKRSLGETPQLSLVAGLAAAEALRETAALSPSIRWPNDLLVRDRKLGGILTEARNGAVVIGLGLNLTTNPADLPDGSTSLAAEGASQISAEPIVASLCRRFSAWYDRWSRDEFAAIHQALRPWIGMFGHPVRLTAGTQQLEGVAQDLDEQGRLVVRLDSGILRAFEVGEVTLLR